VKAGPSGWRAGDAPPFYTFTYLKTLLNINTVGLLVIGPETFSPQQRMQTRMAKPTMLVQR